jgi:hypothetical protein
MNSFLIPEIIKDLRSKTLSSRPNSSENNMLRERILAIKEYCERILAEDKNRK